MNNSVIPRICYIVWSEKCFQEIEAIEADRRQEILTKSLT